MHVCVHLILKIQNAKKNENPMYNGQTERLNRTLLDMLDTLEHERKRDWKKYLPPLVACMPTTPQNTSQQGDHHNVYIGARDRDSPMPRPNGDFVNVISSASREMRSVNNGMSGQNQNWNPRDGAMSAARRTFCLFTAFDLILTFILWVIYTQLIGYTPIWKAFEDQVFQYRFTTSLFDTVMISVARFTFIMLAYALFRISHWWVIAISTTMTCIYLLCKCFLFEFNDNILGGKNPLSYIILIVCFILSWIETWMLDFKVVPTEKKYMKEGTEREPLLSNRQSSPREFEDTREYYSPFHTPHGSDEEAEVDTYSSAQSQRTSPRKASDASLYSVQSGVSGGDTEKYLKLLEEAREGMDELLKMDGWKHESGKSMEDTGMVYSQYVKKYKKKIFRLESIVNLPPKILFEDMIATLPDSPKWNPTVLESRALQVIDDQAEVTYNIAAEAAGGLVSARDFITVCRFCPTGNGTYMCCGTACTHPDMPVQKKYVRGENGPGGWYFEPVEGDSGKCKFTWIVNSNIKGWLPPAVIDQALSGVLMQYFKLLCIHYAEFVDQSSSDPSIM